MMRTSTPLFAALCNARRKLTDGRKYGLAIHTQATINHLNDNPANIHFAAYEDHAKAGYDVAHELAALVSDYVENGEHEAEFHRLQEKLDLTAS